MLVLIADATRALLPAQFDDCDVGWCSDSDGWQGCSDSAGDVELCVVDGSQSRCEGLGQWHEQVAGEEGSAVCVPGQLEIDFVSGGFVHLHRLVGEQDDGVGGVAVAEGPVVVGCVAVLLACDVGDACEVDGSAPMFDECSGVAQGGNAEVGECGDPGVDIVAVVVVARDEEGAVGRGQPGERRGVSGQVMRRCRRRDRPRWRRCRATCC